MPSAFNIIDALLIALILANITREFSIGSIKLYQKILYKS